MNTKQNVSQAFLQNTVSVWNPNLSKIWFFLPACVGGLGPLPMWKLPFSFEWICWQAFRVEDCCSGNFCAIVLLIFSLLSKWLVFSGVKVLLCLFFGFFPFPSRTLSLNNYLLLASGRWYHLHFLCRFVLPKNFKIVKSAGSEVEKVSVLHWNLNPGLLDP